MNARLESYGADPLCVVLVALDGLDGERIAPGAGKGVGEQSTASAVFEALENYYLQWSASCLAAQETPCLAPAQELAAQPGTAQDRLLRRWAARWPQAVVGCTEFSPRSGGTPWRYPSFLTLPSYHLTPAAGDDSAHFADYLRYSASIGTAAGTSLTESVLHALGELVEHDALAHALLRWFVLDDERRIAIDRASLGGDLAELADQVEGIVGPLQILDITTDLGIPVVLAMPIAPFPHEPCYGMGASLDPGYAVERALTELLQMWWMTTKIDPRPYPLAENLARWPRLSACVRMDTSRFRAADMAPLRGSVGSAGSPRQLLAAFGAALAAHGIDYAVRELTPSAANVTVATVLAPGLDRFSLVQTGVAVVPTGRAYALWEQARQ